MYRYSVCFYVHFFDKNKLDSIDFCLKTDGAGQRQKSSVKQSFIISVFLLILIATTVFALGSNTTGNIISNATNQSGKSNPNAINESLINGSINDNSLPEDVNVQNISQQQDIVEVVNESTNTNSEGNETMPENNTSPEENTTLASNESIENETGILEFPQYNETNASNEELNVTLPEINETEENATIPGQNVSENTTLPEYNATNATLPEENITQPGNESIEEPVYNQTNQTKLNIELLVPKRVTRGEVVSLQAIVRNVGSVEAKNVSIRWSLPNYFVTSNNLFKECGTVAVGEYCEHTIEVVVTRSAKLGLNEVKVFAEYE